MGLNNHLLSQSEPSVTLYGTESEESTKKSSQLKGTPKACDVEPGPQLACPVIIRWINQDIPLQFIFSPLFRVFN